MAEDRPLFDDAWLPDWMIKAGITFGGSGPGQDQATAGRLTPPDPLANVDLPSTPLAAAGELSGSGAVPPWMQQAPSQNLTQNRETSAAVPDWMQRGSSTVVEPSKPELPGWMRHDTGEAAVAAT